MQFKYLLAFLPALAVGADITTSPTTYSHGDTSVFQGVEYKLHQIGDDAFRGVKPEDWDDESKPLQNIRNSFHHFEILISS